MVGRTRSRSSSIVNGYGYRFGQVIGGGVRQISSQSTVDETGYGDCGQFDMNRWSVDGSCGKINTPNGGYYSAYMVDYQADILLSNGNFPHLSVGGIPIDVEAATAAAARTNPSRPYVDVVQNVLELGDVVRLIKHRGDGIVADAMHYGFPGRWAWKTAARTNLLYRFGIAPLVGDLVKLCNFNDQLARRVAILQKLQTPKGYRKTVDIGTYSATSKVSKPCQSNYVTVNRVFEGNTVVKVKAHCRWKPVGDLTPLQSPASMRALARKAVLGLTVDQSSAWELLPWSWLIDYASNVGQYFAAQRNIVPAQLTGVHVMRHTRTTWTCPGQYPMTGINFERETKSRKASFVAPVAHFEVLNSKQMGILASLMITRM